MNLKEPRIKKHRKLESQSPFPISIGQKNEWTVFTAHMSVSGTCIADPEAIRAIHLMGYFGKGSLSRGFPNFGKHRFGVPPLIRNRQWKRRQQWLDEVEQLHSEDFPFVINDQEMENLSNKNSQTPSVISLSEKGSQESVLVDEPMETNFPEENDMHISNRENNQTDPGPSKRVEKVSSVDEVILDSTEEDEICEILETNDRQRSDSQNSEILILNDEHVNPPLQPDEYLDSPETEGDNIDPHEVLVLPDSDSDTENYLKNIKPKIETKGFFVTETLQLTFEETFFLMYGLGCLQVINYDGKVMSIVEAWNHFNEKDKYFVSKYIVYHYFRSKGWVVKPGLKFGGDFLLYKQGPVFYHASYIVGVEAIEPVSLLRDESKCTRKMTWNGLMQSNRLAEVTAKEYMIAQVIWPVSVPLESNPVPLESLAEFTVRELLWRRWKQNQINENDSFEDEDSEDEDSS